MAYQNKTQETQQSVQEYLDSIPDEQVRKDSYEILKMMKTASGHEPKIWGAGLIGFGKYRYQGKSCEGEWFVIGFAPRKQKFSLYLMGGLQTGQETLAKLGKYKLGKGCLYFNKLADVDKAALRKLVDDSVKANKNWLKPTN